MIDLKIGGQARWIGTSPILRVIVWQIGATEALIEFRGNAAHKWVPRDELEPLDD